MKTASPDLFELIHSLTKSEKRFIKVFAYAEGGDKKYIELFDIISQQSSYHEAAVQDKLRTTKNAFAVKKKYLYNMILNRMAILHSSQKAHIRTLLTQSDFLHAKGLYTQEKKILHQAKKHAERFDLNNYLLEILGKEYWLSWKELDIPKSEGLLKEREKAFTALNIEQDYHSLEGKINILFVKFGQPEALEEIKKIMLHPLLAKESNTLSFDARRTYYNIHCSYHVISGNNKNGYVFAKKLVDLYIAEPEKARHKTVSFLIALTNLIHLCNELKLHEEEKFYLGLLLENSKLLKAEHERSWAFYAFHQSNLTYYIQTGQFREALPSVEKLQRELSSHEYKLDNLLIAVLHYQMAVVWFGTEKYSKTLDLLNGINNQEGILAPRPDLECAIRIFYLITHFEKGNYDLIAHLLKKKKVGSKDRHYKFENIMRGFFQKQANGASVKKIQASEFIQLKKELLSIQNDPYEKAPLQVFDFISWAESKIERNGFSDVVSEKAKR